MRVFRAAFCVLAAAAVAVSLGADIVGRPVLARTAEFHVVIDAGHGGMDGGAESRGGTKEADINLSIAKFLERELNGAGIGTTLTRPTRDNLANPFAPNKKRDDMNKRRLIIEKVRPDLVVSLHLDSLPAYPAVRGVQTFYDKSSPLGKAYAEIIQHTFNASALHTNRRASVGDYYILNCTHYPSVLVECGFLSNPDEERLLKTAEYQKIIAQNIAAALILAKESGLHKNALA